MKQAEKSVPAGRRPHPRASRRERGAALLLFMILVVMAALAYLISNLTPEAVELRRAQKTEEALTLAREALIGYALRYRDDQVAKDLNSDGNDDRVMYGYLPLPDLGSSRNNNIDPKCKDALNNPLEGCDANTFTGLVFDAYGIGPSVIGRLPWRTLGIEPLRDGHGECLWLIVSSLHSRIQRSAPPPALPPMNWDTLGQLDIVVANGGPALISALANAHERPVAIVFSPGPPLIGQNRGDLGGNDVTQCGGNYDAKNYLDPTTATALVDVTNYLTGANNASGTTGDSDPSNDPDTPKKLTTQGKVFASGGNFLPNACQGGDCTLLTNDKGLVLSSDTLFGAIRKNKNFRTDINAMLDRMTFCLRDQAATTGFTPAAISGFTPPIDKNAGRIPDSVCYDASQNPFGYYDHYKEMVFVAKPNSGNFTVNGDANCAGVLLFANQRSGAQQRVTTAQKDSPANYLEGANLASFTAPGTSFAGDILFDRVPPQSIGQDIARCIPTGALFTPATSSTLTTLGFGQLVAYDASTRTLTLGRANVTTAEVGTSNANALFGSAWLADTRTVGKGLSTYFRFQFKKVGSNVGVNGFVFAMADATRNSFLSAGAAGSHLGYSGNNGLTPMIDFPKIGIEFDQGYNPGFPGTDGESSVRAGRNDPCGSYFCGGTHGFNSHAAIVYWGHDASGADGVTLPYFDDNVHGFPTAGSLPAVLNPPPRSHANPVTESGIKFINMRGYPNNDYDSRIFHTRIELTEVPSAQLAPVRTTEGANVILASPGPSLGGVTLNAGNRVLLQSQSNRAENGVYIWNSATTPMTRATDANQISALTNASVTVTEGTYINSVWRQTSTIATIDVDPQAWQPFVKDFLVQVWVEGDASLTDQIAALRNTTRSVADLYPGYTPILIDAPRFFGIPGDACDASTPCPSGQACASGNVCYRPAMQKIQLGFTNSQRTTDQEIVINDFFTTWLE